MFCIVAVWAFKLSVRGKARLRATQISAVFFFHFRRLHLKKKFRSKQPAEASKTSYFKCHKLHQKYRGLFTAKTEHHMR